MTRKAPRPEISVGAQQEDEFPDSSALATDCVLNMFNLTSRMEAYGMAIARAHGVTSIAAFNVLTILFGEGGPLPPSTIAERMIVSRGTMTGIIGTLERRRFVRREAHHRDGRVRLVRITPSGTRAVRRILPLLHRAERAWMDSLPPQDQARLLRMIAVVQAGGPDVPSDRFP
ncbi:MAG TPA: MarR family transcriptional regulator [Actinomycetota bacterium]|jgi:DNA-binding MarR family transcriptional regulator